VTTHESLSSADTLDGDLSERLTSPRSKKRVVGHVRTVTDLGTLTLFVVFLGVGLALAVVAEETMTGIERDLSEGYAQLPDDVALLVVGLAQVTMLLVIVLVPVGLLLTGRRRSLILGGLAAALAVGLMIALEREVIDSDDPDSVPRQETFLFDDGWPPATALAAYSAAAAVVSPILPRRWRPPVWALLAAIALLRIVTGTSAPANIPIAIALGGVVGTSVLLLFGRELRVNSPAVVRQALVEAGVDVLAVHDVDYHNTPATYLASLTDDSLLDVKVVSPEDWQSDRLQRTFRRLRLRGSGTDLPYSTPRRAVAVESMLIHTARSAGANSPEVVALTSVGRDDVALATHHIDCAALTEVPDHALTDEVLAECWRAVAACRDGQISHGNLQLANLHLSGTGAVWLTGFEFGEPAAEPEALAGDIVELLVGTAVRVGPERAVAAALDVIGPDAVAGAMARMVPAVLTRPTRRALREKRVSIQAILETISAATGVEAPQPVQLERFTPRRLLMAALLGAAVYVLAPQISYLPDMVEAVRSVDVSWLPAVGLASLLTYVGSAVAIIGGTPGRVPFPLSWMVSFAASFVATVAPPGVGNVALTVRFLQQRGFPASVAVTASVAKETAILIVHVLLLVLCAVWVGRSGTLTDELSRLQPGGWLLVVIGVAATVVAVAFSFRNVRRIVARTVAPSIRRSLEAMEQVVRSPTKLLALFSGAAMLPIGYALCLYFSVVAFYDGASFPAVAFVSLTAMTIASAAPTPGGIGAVEAVLLTALTAIGIPPAEGLAAVFLFRIATFWIPIIPGVVAFRVLSARQVI
jgi:uncharacterized protein (TIRG00374 family)